MPKVSVKPVKSHVDSYIYIYIYILEDMMIAISCQMTISQNWYFYMQITKQASFSPTNLSTHVKFNYLFWVIQDMPHFDALSNQHTHAPTHTYI